MGIPKVYGYWPEGDYNLLAIEMLGKSIEKLFRMCHKKFSIATGFVLAEQMVFLKYINSLQE